jgi:cation-transporting ATPase E
METKNKNRKKEIGFILYKNLFVLVNGIIGLVVILLFVFHSTQAGLFIGLILVLNILVGTVLDLRAWHALEQLQFLTAPKVLRLNAGGESEQILVEEIQKDDLIKIKVGDQINCDGIIVESHNLEINEALITGESDSLPKSNNDRLLAGSVVTAGMGIMRSESVFNESRIARMTAGMKSFAVNISPIQESVQKFIQYSVYLTILAIAIALVRGFMLGEAPVTVIKTVGAVASMFVPQGLVFTVTLFFAYGAAHLFQKQVLLQEVNATEKLGRIKNLCMDKTGTLTKNDLYVKEVFVPNEVAKDSAEKLVAAYVTATNDSSELINAIKKYLPQKFSGEILDTLEFSSWRRYGAVKVRYDSQKMIVLAGLPHLFLPQIANERQRQWLEKTIDKPTREGKRVLCFVYCAGSSIPKDLNNAKLSVIEVMILENPLRDGIQHTINFFQNRGVRIRIISGDNAQTVKAIATASGIIEAEKIITGEEMEKWTESDFDHRVQSFSSFAEIVPEQKEKIIQAFKKIGFTAMVGDGANDALAIKKADLGIAMFDGAMAIRQIASIVLTNNSFEALPGGVELADGIIRNIEIFGSVFLNMSLFGIFLFFILSIFGYVYPFTPLNITFINYFTIGIPGLLLSYWTIRPVGKVEPSANISFLQKVMPFTASAAVVQAIGVAIIFAFLPPNIKADHSNMILALSFIVFGFFFFFLAPRVYRGELQRTQKNQLLIWAVSEAILLLIVLHIHFFILFFDLMPFNLSMGKIFQIGIVMVLICFAQYGIAKYMANPSRT